MVEIRVDWIFLLDFFQIFLIIMDLQMPIMDGFEILNIYGDRKLNFYFLEKEYIINPKIWGLRLQNFRILSPKILNSQGRLIISELQTPYFNGAPWVSDDVVKSKKFRKFLSDWPHFYWKMKLTTRWISWAIFYII